MQILSMRGRYQSILQTMQEEDRALCSFYSIDISEALVHKRGQEEAQTAQERPCHVLD
jgi:hypothetical protein